MLLTLLTLSALHAAPTLPAAASDEIGRVLYRGKATDTSALADKFGAEAAAAVTRHLGRYDAWIHEHDYQVAISQDGRVIFVAESVPTAKDRMKLIEKTLKTIDELLPPVDRSASDEAFVDAVFGQADHVPDHDPIVLFEVDTPEAYNELASSLGNVEPLLEAWGKSQTKSPGFLEGRLSVAAWQRIPRDFDIKSVWRTKNELVNRLTRLALHRSYGPQPTWFSVGLAWHVELETMSALYSFPYRKEFVGTVEHEGWKPPLKSIFRKRHKAKDSLKAGEFAGWARNTWNGNEPAIAWGVAQFLCEYESDALPAIAEEFRLQYKAGFRTTSSDGTWSTNPAFGIAADDQTEILVRHTREDLLAVLTKYLSDFKKPR